MLINNKRARFNQMDKKQCRLCFTFDSECHYLLTNHQKSLAQMIELHFQCEVIESDPLPKTICLRCSRKVRNFHEFYQLVKSSQNQFLRNIKTDTATAEDDNPPELDFVECRTDVTILPDDTTKASVEAILRMQKVIDDVSSVPDFFDMNCDLCDTIFTGLNEAKSHYKNDHDKRGYLKCCQRKLSTQGLINDHIQWHSNSEMFRCQICQKTTDSRKALQIHMLNHANRRFTCDLCSKQFAFKQKLKRHILSIHVKPERTFHCQFCVKSFVFKNNLNMHIRFKHESAPRICEVCAKIFRSEVALNSHKRIHEEKVAKPPVQCGICGTWLKDGYKLKTHMLIHTSEPQKCHICGKFSPTPSALKLHINSIHRERTHKCHLCDKAFKNDIVLKGHIATHTGERQYGCSYCSQRFIWRQDMYSHQKKIHPDDWSRNKQNQSVARK